MPSTASNRSVPWVPGAVAGAVAFLLEYLAVYFWQAGNVRRQLRGINAIIQLLGGTPVPAWAGVGWLFYDAHFVAFTYPAIGGSRTALDLIANGNAPTLLYLVPVVGLLLAGFAVGRYAGTTDRSRGAVAGASVAVGYAVLTWIGLFAFRVTGGGSWVGPDPVTGALLAAVLYPIVLGGIGGWVASATR